MIPGITTTTTTSTPNDITRNLCVSRDFSNMELVTTECSSLVLIPVNYEGAIVSCPVSRTTIGGSYSCFTDFTVASTAGCKSKVDDEESGGYVQEAITSIKNMDFCTSGPGYGRAKQGAFGKAKNYIVSADLKQMSLGKYSKSNAYNGLAFNMVDSKNYDIAYVRPQTQGKEFCWEIGYVDNGLLFGRDFGSCVDSVGAEFSIAVKMEDGKGKQPIRTRYLGHVTSYQPIRDQYFLFRSVPGNNTVTGVTADNVPSSRFVPLYMGPNNMFSRTIPFET
eukprot:sb/3467963/